ncbi:histone PARylation factor 1-like [Diadema antillarum]|uniref:histone PARylation factor 1-like n=1 Tax=Diadema antillarum TaxID=105358 RepID=UPI003A83C484
MSDKLDCKYGTKCYRTREDHLQKYRHPDPGMRETSDDDQADEGRSSKRQKVHETLQEEGDAPTTNDGAEPTDTAKGGSVDSEASPSTPPGLDIKEELRLKFKVEMPQDFFDFWEYCKSVNPTEPCGALETVAGLRLGGPFDVMAGNLKPAEGQKPDYFLHHRHFYDPPEFQTVLLGDAKTQHHLGYYRDEPQKVPVFVAANSAKEGCVISPQGENLFGAVKSHIDKLTRQTKDKGRLEALKKTEKSLTEWAKKCGHPLEARTKAMKERDKNVVTKTFHKAGIVVPLDSMGVGYRELPETDATLKKILKKIVETDNEQEKARYSDSLQEIITLVQFANDECDYGQGYELGIDLFSFGHKSFHPTVSMLLSVAYLLLGRGEFGEILEAHLKQREEDKVCTAS